MPIDLENGRPQGGPSTVVAKAIRKEAMKLGMEPEKLPPQLRDSVVAKSKKDKLGAIVVRNVTGLQESAAKRVIKRFEAQVEGHEDIVEKLEALPERKPGVEKLLRLLKEPHKKSLARLVAESGASAIEVMNSYTKGCVELAKIDAAIEASKNLPALIKDLNRHAIDEKVTCMVCVGTGKVAPRKGQHTETVVCPQCEGSGASWRISEHKEWAGDNLLEINEMIKKNKGPLVAVQQNMQINNSPGGFLEKIMESADRILYDNPPIEAEVVPSEDN